MKNALIMITLTIIVSYISMAQKPLSEFEHRLVEYLFDSTRVSASDGMSTSANKKDSITICKIDKYNRHFKVQFVDSLTMEAKKKMLKAKHMAYSYNSYYLDYDGALDEFNVSSVDGSKIYNDKISPPMVYIYYKHTGGYFISLYNGEYVYVDFAGGIQKGDKIEIKNKSQGSYINVNILQGTDNSLY